MFFIDHDQPEARQRGKHRQPRAQHQVGLAEVRGKPVAQALRWRQAAVQRDESATCKALGKARFELRRQVDLGHQHQHLAPGSERLCRGTQVDLGLAAAGDTVQKVGGRRRAAERRDRSRLVGRQLRCRRVRGGLRCRRLQTRQAAFELGCVEPAKFGWQHCERELAEATLVVRGREGDQLAPGLRQWRQRAERLAHVAQLDPGSRAARRLPDDARHVAPSQWNAHQRSRRKRTLTAVVEAARQTGVLRGLDSDGQRARPGRLSHREVARDISDQPQRSPLNP